MGTLANLPTCGLAIVNQQSPPTMHGTRTQQMVGKLDTFCRFAVRWTFSAEKSCDTEVAH